MAVRCVADSGAGGTIVTSVTGTSGQITATPTSGAVVVALAAGQIIPAATTAWVPTDASGATLSLTINGAGYAVYGPVVYAWASITYPTTANTSQGQIGGLPFTIKNSAAAGGSFNINGLATDYGVPQINTTNFKLFAAGGTPRLNSSLSTGTILFQFWYPTA